MLQAMRADDPFLDRYAHGTRAMTASEIRALFAVASRPEVVSLAGGMPFTAALPFDVIGEVVAEVLTEEGAASLQYLGGQGDPRLREALIELMTCEGIHASEEEVIVTAGSQQALDLLARMFCDPGDVIVAEGPSYVGALSAFSQYQVEVRHVPLDEQGLDPAALEDTLERLDNEGKRVKFLYTVPNYHNPAGVTMNAERRPRVLDLARRHDVLVVEDNPYGRLGFEGDPPPALRADDAENVVYLGSLSKVFCPGLRIGWALVPPALRERMVLVKEAADLCSSSFAQSVAYRYFRHYPWRQTLKALRDVYRERRDAMLDALDEDFPAGARWNRPHGGFYVWLELPDQLDARAMLAKAIAARVAYVPGGAFYADGQGTSQIRLSYCFPAPDRIREGVRRLAGVVAEELDLLRALGGIPKAAGDVDDSPPAGWGGVQ
ncbi:MAG TPA: PLP-dependent aminotransferase family protein [Actinomycetes bacterium]|jgi:DNA-binding transcriptional MocR family regulator|nr:PLP-dependent aminotransferase family protein [Actinomycetes bacterium]